MVRAPTGAPDYTPAKESDEFSHGINERIPVASFHAALEHWYVLPKEIAGSAH